LSLASAKFSENLSTKKQLIQMSFFEKVNNGMRPKDAYLDVLQTDFDFNAIPNLNALPTPYFMGKPDYFQTLTKDPDFIKKQYDKAAQIFNNSNMTHRDLQNYLSNLSKLDFIEDIFNIRMSLTNNDLEQATKAGTTSVLTLPENL